MITLGVDLAADPRKTAACLVDWSAGSVLVRTPASDDAILDLATGAELVGIDVPLGWPEAFVRAVGSHHAGEQWPEPAAESVIGRAPLRYRRTDLVLREDGHSPLSVSTELLGVVALRAAGLQQRFRDAGLAVDRSGTSGRLAEVYPAAALKQWGLVSRGYKGTRNALQREVLVGELAAALGDRGSMVSEALAGCSDHVLDAFVCAVLAAAVKLGMTGAPTVDDLPLARREGWIHVPTTTLADIVSALSD